MVLKISILSEIALLWGKICLVSKNIWLKEVPGRPFTDQSIKYKHVSKCHLVVTSNEHVHLKKDEGVHFYCSLLHCYIYLFVLGTVNK